MARGRISRANTPEPKVVTEYRPTGADGYRVLTDGIYKLRNRRLIEMRETHVEGATDVAVTNISDQVFNPREGGNSVPASYIIGVQIFPGVQFGGAGSGVLDNYVHACRFFLPFDVVLSAMVIDYEGGNGAPGTYGVGWYDTDKNLIWQSGAQTTGTLPNGARRTTLPNIALPSGSYFQATTRYSNGGLGPQISVLNFNTNAVGTMMNSGQDRIGRAANDGSAGILPATLGGAFIGPASDNIMFVLYELA